MSADETALATPTVDPVCGWLRLWHRRGVQVTIPLRGDIDTFAAQVDKLFDAGWLNQCPGLEEGEEKEEIGFVCRLDHDGERGLTPTVLLYSTTPQLTYSYLRKYMNTPEEVKDFEFACGVRYDDLPNYPGKDHPQRGTKGTDQFIKTLKKPATMVYKQNPRYQDAPAPPAKDGRSASEKTKRLFVRWADTRPAEAEQPKADGKPDMAIVKSWEDWFEREDSNCAALNKRLPEVAKATSKYDPWTRVAVWTLIKGKAQMAGWHFSDVSHEFTPPNNQTFAEPY